MSDSAAATRRVHLAGLAALIVTVGLTVGVGGTITSAEVGMAYPTWPDINGGSLFSFFYGELAAEFGLGSVVEHMHRQAGALTGALALLAAGLAWSGRGVCGPVRALATAAMLATVAQGLLGALRVLGNSYGGAIVHALGAQGAIAGHLTLALPAAAALLVAGGLGRRAGPDAPRLRSLALRLHAALGLQILLGAAAWLWLLGPFADGAAGDRDRFLLQAGLATAHLLVGVLVMAAAAALWIEARWRTAAAAEA
jgi:heme A synthase